MTTYIAFAFSLNMISSEKAVIFKQRHDFEPGSNLVKMQLEGAVSAANPRHASTVAEIKRRFDIDIEVPEKPPSISLDIGDVLWVIQVGSLPRLDVAREYTEEEMAIASLTFERVEILK